MATIFTAATTPHQQRVMTIDTILQVRDLAVEFDTYGGTVHAVRGVSFDVVRGRTLAVVGESGCGKSVTMQSIVGLIPMPPGRITRGTALLNGREILGRWDAEQVRGQKIGMIFQDPMTSLNPTMSIGAQIAEPLIVHGGMSRNAAMTRAVELLTLSRIPDAAERATQYPFQFSGGMLQRAMIALALAGNPSLLIADEPTTALDVTIQAQILELLVDLQEQAGMSIVLITHDLAVVARMADEVLVMYAGEIVEHGSVDAIFNRSAHPYTLGLKKAMPSSHQSRSVGLTPIAGSPPDLFAPPAGCGYFARCPYAMKVCETARPPLFSLRVSASVEPTQAHEARCWLHHLEAPSAPSGLHAP